MGSNLIKIRAKYAGRCWCTTIPARRGRTTPNGDEVVTICAARFSAGDMILWNTETHHTFVIGHVRESDGAVISTMAQMAPKEEPTPEYGEFTVRRLDL